MRELATADRIRRFFRELGRRTCQPATVPVRDGWDGRSAWETTERSIVVRHFDLEAQALSQIERSHDRDRADVDEMLRRGLVTASGLIAYFDAVEPFIFRYPAIDSASLRRRAHRLVAPADG